MKCKRGWLDFAEVFDTLRVVPRIILFAYAWWAAYVTDWLIKWYQRLPAVERTGQVTAFVTVVLPGIFGLAVWVYKIYADGGRSWEQPNQQTMQTVQTISPVPPVAPVAPVSQP